MAKKTQLSLTATPGMRYLGFSAKASAIAAIEAFLGFLLNVWHRQ